MKRFEFAFLRCWVEKRKSIFLTINNIQYFLRIPRPLRQLFLFYWTKLWLNGSSSANGTIFFSQLFVQVLCLQLFRSEILLGCIFIPDLSILRFLWQILIFFHLARSLISLLWKIITESELGKRFASLNREGTI